MFRVGFVLLLAGAAVVAAPVPKDLQPRTGTQREFEIAKGVTVTFCWMPSGECQLGSPTAEREAVLKLIGGKPLPWWESEAEEKRGRFRTGGFWLGKYTVTQKEYEAVMGYNPSSFEGERQPVEKVSWDDCQAFLKKCTRPGVRLPHENEWEYAARGGLGNKRPYYWGNALNGTEANCDGSRLTFGTDTAGPNLRKPLEGGSYAKAAPHPWGLCDMLGNVWQWCDNAPESGPADRIIRGGGWNAHAFRCRAAYRYPERTDWKYQDLGFRLCLPRK
jgi:formylglycine-generating enzyme required for sulfatase activity